MKIIKDCSTVWFFNIKLVKSVEHLLRLILYPTFLNQFVVDIEQLVFACTNEELPAVFRIASSLVCLDLLGFKGVQYTEWVGCLFAAFTSTIEIRVFQMANIAFLIVFDIVG